jgi:hypothetical protein
MPAPVVVSGAQLMCAMGVAPVPMTSLPVSGVLCGGMPVTSVSDVVPMINVPSFGMCMSPVNPEVVTATAAAMGVLTPMPCVPVLSEPWTPGSPTVLVAGAPVVTEISTCSCMWGGQITVVSPGQATTLA